LASSVSYSPGWVARVAGSPPIEAIEVNGGFLGFVLPPGARDVHLDYRPRSFTIGLAACAAGLLALALAAAWSWRRQRQPAIG
ncbi:MAG TPA: YfhO family protein, partial [Thermoanaerobaculia bacterium]